MHVHNSFLLLEQFYNCSLSAKDRARNVTLNRRQDAAGSFVPIGLKMQSKRAFVKPEAPATGGIK